MQKQFLTAAALLPLLLTQPVHAQGEATAKPAPVETALAAALAKAKTQNKAVFVEFHASWCGWCKRLEKALADPEIKRIWDNNYVTLQLDVLERGEKVSLENPGAKAYMTSLGGEKSGLPFYAFLDSTGKKIADSNVMGKGENIGYPGAPDEVGAFVTLLKKSAPRLNDTQAKTITDYFIAHAPKQTAAAQ